LIFYRFMRHSPLKRCRHVTLLRLKMHLYRRRTLARLHPRVVGKYYIFQASSHRFYAIAEHYTCGMARLNPFEGYVKPTKSRFSRSQKTVVKTVKPLETGGNARTSVKDNEQGEMATAASQGIRAGRGVTALFPKKKGAQVCRLRPSYVFGVIPLLF
jgi:hypothetical protein